MVRVTFEEKVKFGVNVDVNSVLTRHSRCDKVVLYQSIIAYLGVQVATVHDKSASIFGK